jgi:hypothetical protein
MAAKYQELADDPGTPPEKLKAARGIVRGLAMALTLYEDSYNYSTQRVLKVEKDFL